MRMPPNTRRYSSTAIIRKHSAASSGPGEVRWPSLIRVAGLATTMPAVFRPIRPRNRPTPAPMANLRLRGMLLSSHSRTREKVSSMNITPGDEHRAEGDLPAVAHGADHGVGEEGVQPHSRRQAHRPVGVQAHQEAAEGGRQARGDERRAVVDAGVGHDVGIDEDDVGHGDEGGQPGRQLGP